MTKFHQALERGEPLVILLDFEMFDESGVLLARHHLSMNPHAETTHQYDDRLMEFRSQVRLLGDFGVSGLAELTEGALRLADSETLSAFRDDVARAARTTIEVRATAAGLPSSESIPSGLFDVLRLREEDDGSLSAELSLPDRRLRATRLAVPRILGLNQALDGAASATVAVVDENLPGQGDRRLDPIDALIIGVWIRLGANPTAPAILGRRHTRFFADIVFEFSIEPGPHPAAKILTSAELEVTVLAADLTIAIGEWSFVELLWSSAGQKLTLRLNGQTSATTATVAALAPAWTPLAINFGSSIPGEIAEYRYSTKPIDLPILDRRALRRLEESEIADYGPYFTFDGEHLLDDRTVFDLSPSALHGKANPTLSGPQAFVFVASETGTKDMSGKALPRVVGLATALAGERISADGRSRQFCQGPVRAFRKVTTQTNDTLWLKLSQTVQGVLSPASLRRDPASEIDLSGYQRFQTVRVTSPAMTMTATVSMATPDAVFFRHDADDAEAFAIAELWTIETADPGTWTGLSCHGNSSTGRVRVDSLGAPFENFFRNSRVGQKLILPDPVLPSKTYTIAASPESPFAEVTVAEPVFDGPVSGSVSLLEYFDAVADLDAGVIRLTDDIGDVEADVVVEAQPTPRGVIEHLLALGGQAAELPALNAYETDFGFALAEESTVGEMLAAAARSLDGVLWRDQETGEIRFEALAAPANAPEVDFPEIVHVERLDEVEPFGALELRYRQKGTSSQAESVVVPTAGATLRRDAPVLETLYQKSAAAVERAEAVFDLRKNGQEVYAVDVPLRYFRPDLPFRSVSLSGARRLADKTWRVIGLGLTAPGLCRLLVWRNLTGVSA